MKHCVKCKNKDTLVCGNCDNGSLWEDSGNSFPLIISAVMFGCGLGGILAALYAFYSWNEFIFGRVFMFNAVKNLNQDLKI